MIDDNTPVPDLPPRFREGRSPADDDDDDSPPAQGGGRPGDDDSWQGVPMLPPDAKTRQWEEEDRPSGTQAFWQQSLSKAPMPTSRVQHIGEGPTSDTDRLPPPFAPPTEPQAYNVDKPASMPGQTGGTMDKGRINKLPPAAPGVPGTRDQPSAPKGFFSPPPQDPHEILYTERGQLGGHLAAVNA
jgi:hypothetical protein